jgi:hypothetical protein
MTPRTRATASWAATAGLVLALVAVVPGPSDAPARPASAEAYAPVAPAAAVHRGLKTNLDIARGWIEEKDFGSAAATAQALAVLAELHGYQSPAGAWRAYTAALRDACLRLAAAARAKDRPACLKCLQECDQLLADLAKGPPPGEKGGDGLLVFGANRVWMMLLDWAYADARTARSAKELESLAYLLAEEAQAVALQRPAPQWRQAAQGVRDAALAAVKKAQADDLPGARVALKKAYESCTACHEGFRRP